MGLGEIKETLFGLKDKALEKIHGLFENNAMVKILIAVAAVVVLVPLITVIAVLSSKTQEKKLEEELIAPEKIKLSDVFFPAEPDFLPPVIFEQKQKEKWSTEDARPFWTNPEDFGKDYWQGKVGENIDKILERVP